MCPNYGPPWAVLYYLGFLQHHLIPFNQNLTILSHQHQHYHYHHYHPYHAILSCYHGNHIVVVGTNDGVNLWVVYRQLLYLDFIIKHFSHLKKINLLWQSYYFLKDICNIKKTWFVQFKYLHFFSSILWLNF